MKKVKISIIIILLLYTSLFSQTPQNNLNKYWEYRERLKTNFMVSANQFTTDLDHIWGLNIPAQLYNPTDSGKRDYA